MSTMERDKVVHFDLNISVASDVLWSGSIIKLKKWVKI